MRILDINDVIEAEPHQNICKNDLVKAMNVVKKYGQFKLILVYEDEARGIYKAIAGRAILHACRELGLTHVFCFVFGKISQDDSHLVNIIDNTPREVDVIATARRLEGMTNKDLRSLSNYLPFSAKELQNFRDLKDFNWDDFDNDVSNFQTSLFG